jgi:pimeloyl-ACP methyl ester carboxylesterase
MSKQTHYLPCVLPAVGSSTTAQWAVKPGGKAVIFVHGFNGKSLGSWVDFPRLLPREAKCEEYDVIFYGYDGLYTQATTSAVLLSDFLDQLFADPLSVINATINPQSKRAAGFRYDSVVLVAHSLGSVVCRMALLNAHKGGKPWVNYTRLVLFAPAHMGARVKDLALNALTGIHWVGALLTNLTMFKLQALDGLSDGSPMISNLLAETNSAIAQGATALKAHKVIWAEKENIVSNQNFAQDPPPKIYRGKGHMDVCKPNGSFTDPVSDLLGAL